MHPGPKELSILWSYDVNLMCVTSRDTITEWHEGFDVKIHRPIKTLFMTHGAGGDQAGDHS